MTNNWLNKPKANSACIRAYREAFFTSGPKHVVIDGLFNDVSKDHISLYDVVFELQKSVNWQTQRHSYDALYVEPPKWQQTPHSNRFVERSVWQRKTFENDTNTNAAYNFLVFLRSRAFMDLLSNICDQRISDALVSKPSINTNFFRLGSQNFINKHADDSPGRVMCLLLYLNKDWDETMGGELVFKGRKRNKEIAPLFNRCVLFDPASRGSEHWVKPITQTQQELYRYNVTSWYWAS